jgi:hypothetical protein
MVQNIRITCQHLLMRARAAKEFSVSQSVSSDEHEVGDSAEQVIEKDTSNLFEISLEDAHKFSKNTNLLHFIRK